MSTRDDYIAKMKQQLDELAAQMSRLEAKAQEAKADARDKYREELAKGKLNDLKAAGEDKWKPWSQRWKKFATLSNILGWRCRLLRWA